MHKSRKFDVLDIIMWAEAPVIWLATRNSAAEMAIVGTILLDGRELRDTGRYSGQAQAGCTGREKGNRYGQLNATGKEDQDLGVVAAGG